MRRSMVISIAGFFVPNLLAEFGAIPQLHQSFHFMPGICGSAGVFSASMALFLGYFHRKWIHGTIAAIAGLSLPYVATRLSFEINTPSPSAGLLQLFGPTVVVAIGTYFALMQWHAMRSNLPAEVLTGQLVTDEYGKPKEQWGQVIYGAFQVMGVVMLLLLILAALGHGR